MRDCVKQIPQMDLLNVLWDFYTNGDLKTIFENFKAKFIQHLREQSLPYHHFEEAIDAEYIEIDVSTDDGYKFAAENGITHSGCAWYEVNEEIKIKWGRPVPATKLLADIKQL